MVERICEVVGKGTTASDIPNSRGKGGTRPYRLTRPQAVFVKNVLVTTLLIIIVLIIDFPIFWMVSSSLKGPGELFLREPNFIPKNPVWENYPDVFVRLDYAKYFANSLIVALSTTVTAVIIGSISGYSFARFRYRGRNPALFLILISQMFPASLLVIPLFLILNQLRLINTHLGLVLAYTTFVLPFSVWMMKGFYTTIPVDLEEAALLDGCTRLQVLFKIVLPLAAPGAAATASFAFVVAWNEFLFALNLTTGNETRTLPIGLSLLVGRYFNNWGVLMAAAVITTIPTLLVFLGLQKYLIRGLTAGAVKE
jgi:ABC-type glycerol-3-phosphate transport system permease component